MFNATVSNVTLHFTNNAARLGGAIYVEDRGYNEVKSVFDLQGEDTLVKLWFQNNSALFGGNHIYGGWVDWLVDKNITNILKFIGDDKEVASDPIRICLCNDRYPNCSITNEPKEIQGCALNLDIVAVGQRLTPVIAYIDTNLKVAGSESDGKFPPRIKSLQTTCTNVNFLVNGNSSEEMLVLKPYLEYDYDSSKIKLTDTTQQKNLVFQQLSIQLKQSNCRVGFVQHNDCECVCHPSLSSLGLSCDMKEYKINKNKQQWIGVTHEHTTTGENTGVLVHQHCPFDYCRMNNETLLIRLENQDEQCAFDRMGTLCGGCKTNFSSCLLYTSPSPRDATLSRMPSSA